MSTNNPSTPRQGLAQTQNLQQIQTLSPQQVLYGRLLGLNAIEMEDEVRRALDENPALEVDDDMVPPQSDEAEASLPPSEEGEPFDESAERLQLSDYSNEDDIPFITSPDSIDRFISSSGRIDPSIRARETVDASVTSTIVDFLNEQLAELPLTERQRIIARHIIGNIDDNGYLAATLRQISDDMALNEGLDVTLDEVNAVFDAIRTLDPPGICAVDLRDCLLLQLHRRRAKDNSPAMATACEMVADWFDLFSKRHFDRLCSALDIDRERLRKAVDIVHSLNPKPGGIFSGSHVDDYINQITPDFFVDIDGTNIDLRMNNTVPQLRIESSFDISKAAPLPRRKGEPDPMAFIRARRDEAATYINVVDARRRTLFRVMRAIISLQRDFFLSEGDISRLRPMILRDVEAITGDDISVISRATAGKYIATPWGTYPLKFFFNGSPNPESADATIKVIETLRGLIAAEDPADPLSDAQLADMLREKGYNIARRTVAKYRERIAVPVARLRRRI